MLRKHLDVFLANRSCVWVPLQIVREAPEACGWLNSSIVLTFDIECISGISNLLAAVVIFKLRRLSWTLVNSLARSSQAISIASGTHPTSVVLVVGET